MRDIEQIQTTETEENAVESMVRQYAKYCTEKELTFLNSTFTSDLATLTIKQVTTWKNKEITIINICTTAKDYWDSLREIENGFPCCHIKKHFFTEDNNRSFKETALAYRINLRLTHRNEAFKDQWFYFQFSPREDSFYINSVRYG